MKKTTSKISILSYTSFILILLILSANCKSLNTEYKSEFDFDEICTKHNEILKEMLTSNKIEASTKESLFDFVKSRLNDQGQNLDVDFKTFQEKIGNNLKDDMASTVSHMVSQKLINENQGNYLLEIDRNFARIDDEKVLIRGIDSEIENLTIDNSFSNQEKDILMGFLVQSKYSLNLLSELEDVENEENLKSACNKKECKKCLKRNFWKIVSIDGLGLALGIINCVKTAVPTAGWGCVGIVLGPAVFSGIFIKYKCPACCL